jgi:CheY-like chemotaxis protein
MHKILVIDDDKITHAFVKRALANKYVITDTFNGEQGLAELKIQQPEVILLDVEMPGLNGYEVCERIKADEDTAEIPVIFFSARGDLRDRMQGFEAGADDCKQTTRTPRLKNPNRRSLFFLTRTSDDTTDQMDKSY